MRAGVISPEQQFRDIAAAVYDLDAEAAPRHARRPPREGVPLVKLVAARFLAEELEPIEVGAFDAAEPDAGGPAD